MSDAKKTESALIGDAGNILPCPFCGSVALHYHRADDSGWSNTDWICCTNEDCGCGTCMHETKESAIAAWNRRAPLSASPDDAIAWVLMREQDPTYPKVFKTEADADAKKAAVNVGPLPYKVPVIDPSSYLLLSAPQDEDERRERILDTVVAPDNGARNDVLNAILASANAWAPEARIIGNIRAGDIARAVQAVLDVAPDDDWTVSASETAREVLDHLGIGSDASLEPGADRRRDAVAKIITRHFDRLRSEMMAEFDENVSELRREAGRVLADANARERAARRKSRSEDRTVYWLGSEEDEHRERLKACKARIAQYGDDGECDHEGMCAECEHDMAIALRVTKEEYEAAGID